MKKKKENFAVRALKGMGCYLLSEVMSMFLVLSMAAFSVATGGAVWLKIIISVCCLALTLGLYFNWAFKAAEKDRDEVKFHNVPYDRFMPLKMALIAPAVSYLSFIALALSKLGVMSDIFNVYLLMNLFFLPAVDSFTSGRTLEFLTFPGLFGLLLLTLTQPAVIAGTYIITFRNIDFIAKLMYKK